MKIALIMVKGNVYGFKNRSFIFKYMPDSLTLGTLYGIIKHSFPEIEVEIYDETVETLKKENIKADLIGISAITPCINKAYAYADYFRQQGIPVFIGGVHATLNPKEVKEHCDAVVKGLADETLPQLINDFKNGALKPFYEQNPDMSYSNLVFPQRKIYEDKSFLGCELNMVYATFGCTNRCGFCVQPYVCGGYHQRPVDDVISEIKLIEDDYIEFIDPNLAKDENYLKKLCQKLIPLKKRWFAPLTISVCKNEELLDLMQQSGCEEILIGFESINQDSVKGINKGFNRVDDYKECIKQLHKRKIKITGSFVLGLDSDTKESLLSTADFVKEAHIDYVRYTINTPYPGTEYYEKMKSQGRIVEDDWNLYDCQNCVFEPVNMTAQELESIFKTLWQQTYTLKNIFVRLSYIKNPFTFVKDVVTNYIFGRIYINMVLKEKSFIKKIFL